MTCTSALVGWDGVSDGSLLGCSLTVTDGDSLGFALTDGTELGEADTLGGLKIQDSLHGLFM